MLAVLARLHANTAALRSGARPTSARLSKPDDKSVTTALQEHIHLNLVRLLQRLGEEL
jgi:hypothetical protein